MEKRRLEELSGKHTEKAKHSDFISKKQLNNQKSDFLKKSKLHSDPFQEIVEYKKIQELKNINFIREICYMPLRLFLIHEEAFKIIKQEIKQNGFLSLHLDCTGSLLNKYHEKQPFYYSVCLPSFKVNSEICPQVSVADAILTDHSTHSIKTWLGKFLQLIEKNTNRSHVVKKIEVDFSWAFLHASVEVFNKVDLKTYLQRSFDVCTKVKEVSSYSFFTIVHMCSAHVIKAIANNLSKATSKRVIKNKFLFCFARLQNSTDLYSAKKFFFHIVVVFTSEFESKNFFESLTQINNQIKNPSLNLNELSFNGDSKILETNNFYSNFEIGLCKGSPFYSYFKSVHFEAEQIVNVVNSGKRNIFYCPAIFKFILDKYMPIFSLWSGVHMVDLNKTRDTNGHVENWFRVIKNSIFEPKRYRLKNFVEILYSNLSTRYYERECAYVDCMQESSSARKRKVRKTITAQPLDETTSSSLVKESWSKKRCLTPAVKPFKTKYYLAPKIIKPINQKLQLGKHHTHHDHSYFADPKTSKKLYNINEIYNENIKKSSNTIINTIGPFCPKGEDIKTLHGKQWLNDEIINSYFKLIVMNKVKYVCVDSQAWANYKNKLDKKIVHKFRKTYASLTDLELIFIPIHEAGNHWSLGVVFIGTSTICYYNSINPGNNFGHGVCDSIKQFLISSNYFSDADKFVWHFNYPPTPQQVDGHSCGVYICQFAKQIAKGKNLKIVVENLPNIRKEMVAEIALGILFN